MNLTNSESSLQFFYVASFFMALYFFFFILFSSGSSLLQNFIYFWKFFIFSALGRLPFLLISYLEQLHTPLQFWWKNSKEGLSQDRIKNTPLWTFVYLQHLGDDLSTKLILHQREDCNTSINYNIKDILQLSNSITRVEVPNSCSDFKDSATSGFRPKVHSRTESLSLEILDMNRNVGRESLDIPKIGHESLDMGRGILDIPKFGRLSLDMGPESLCPDFCDPCLDFRDQFLVWPDFCDPCPDFRDQILVRPDFLDPCPDFRDQILVYLDFLGPRRNSCPGFLDSNSRRD